MIGKETILMKQSGLTLEELINTLKRGGSGHRNCLLVNDLAIFFWKGSKEAKDLLLEILGDPARTVNERFIAFCALSSFPKPDNEIPEATRAYRENPANKELVEEADRLIKVSREILEEILV